MQVLTVMHVLLVDTDSTISSVNSMVLWCPLLAFDLLIIGGSIENRAAKLRKLYDILGF